MGKYSERLFSGQSGQADINQNVQADIPKNIQSNVQPENQSGSQPGKYSSLLFGGIKKPEKQYIENPYVVDTSEISTITGKPIKEPSMVDYKPADFGTLFKASFVDNDNSKIKLFSEARGIDSSRYEIKNGKVWFKGDDGKMYPESPKEPTKIIKKLLAELPASSFADIGSAIGVSVGSIPGAAAGAAIGEAIRKEIGEQLFGDEQTWKDYASDVGVQALFGTMDASIAKKISGYLSSRKIRKATGGKISDDFTKIVGDIEPGQRVRGQVLKTKADSIGVDILPHQAMDDPSLTQHYKLLRDNPKTSRAVRTKDDQLENQIYRAGEDLVKNISNRKTDPFEVGEELSKAGNAAIEKMKKIRGDAVKGLYEKANTVTDVDITPALEEITRLRGNVKPGMKVHSALNRIERMLTIKDGKEILPESRLEVLDNVKQEIDAILQGKDSSTITNKMKRKMQGIKDILTTQTDKVSREYQVARALFTAASPKIMKTEKGIVGVLSRMTTDEMKEKAVQKIFFSPHSIRAAKKSIMKDNPELWKDTVAEFFSSEFGKSARVAQGSGGKVLNRAGKYTSKMWDMSSKEKIKIATEGMKDGNGDPLFSRISDFFDVMKAASIGQGKESATWERAKIEQSMRGLPEKLKTGLSGLRKSFLSFGLDATGDKAFDRNAKKLLELMQTPEGVDLIAKAKGYGMKTEKGIQAVTTLLLMATQTNAGKAKEAVSTYLDQSSQGE